METYSNFYNVHYPIQFITMLYEIDSLNYSYLIIYYWLSIKNNNFDMMNLIYKYVLVYIFDNYVILRPYLFE